MTDQEEDQFYVAVGELIKSARKKATLKQEALADLVGLDRSSIVNIEKGRHHAAIHVLWQLAKHLNVDMSKLVPPYPTEKIDVELKKLVTHEARGDKHTKERLISFIEDIKSTNKQ